MPLEWHLTKLNKCVADGWMDGWGCDSGEAVRQIYLPD